MQLFPALATTVAAVAAIVIVTFLVFRTEPAPTPVAGWDVSSVEGTPRIGRTTIGGKEGKSRLGIGQMLETDRQSRASLQADDIGQIQVDQSTRLRLLSMGSGLKRIALDRGTIHTSATAHQTRRRACRRRQDWLAHVSPFLLEPAASSGGRHQSPTRTTAALHHPKHDECLYASHVGGQACRKQCSSSERTAL